MRHSSLSCVGTGMLIGAMLGAAGAVMLGDRKSMRNTRRCAQKALHTMEDFLCDVKHRMF